MILAMILAALILGEDLETPSYRAQVYFEAGEYDRAALEYDQLLQGKLTKQERSLAVYNLGCILLAKGEWQRAIGQFEKIDLGMDPAPLLTKQLYKNLIVACLKGSQQIMQQEGDFKIRIQEARALLQKGFVHWEKALESSQQLAIVEGDQTLQVPEELSFLHQTLKEEIAILYQLEEEHQRKSRSLVEAYRFLADNVKQSIQSIETNEEQAGEQIWDPLHKKRLLQVLSAKQKAKSREWMITPSEEQHEVLLQEAKRHFEESLEQLSLGNVETSHVNQTIAVSLLTMLQRLEQKQDPCEGLLQDKFALCEKRMTLPSALLVLQAAAQQEIIYLQKQSAQLCEQIQAKLKENSPDDLESNIQAKVLSTLQTSLSRPPEEDRTEALHQSGSELALYQQLFLQEEQVLLTLCQELSQELSQIKKTPSNISPNTSCTIRALREKFAARRDLTQAEVERIQLADITETLQLGLDEIADKKQTLSLLEGVLRSWRPVKWLEMKLEQINRREDQLLVENDLTTPAVTELQHLHTQLIGNCQEADIGKGHQQEITLVQSALKRSATELQFCEKQLSRDNRTVATICLEEAQHCTQRSASRLREERQKTAPEMLQEGIEEEQRALKTNQRLKPFIKYREDEKELALLPWYGQEDALTAVSTFSQAVQGCEQAKEALPKILELFAQGCKEAQQAADLLTKEWPEWLTAAEQQKMSIKHWQEALDLLKNPQQNEKDQSSQNSAGGNQPNSNQDQNDQSSSSQEEQSVPSAEEDNSEAPKQDLNADNSPSRIFELLQEMDQEDEEKKEQKAAQKQGLRPW